MVEHLNLNSNSLQSLLEPKQIAKNSANIPKPNDSFKNDEDKRTGRWSPEEDELLKKIVPFYGEKQWRKISQHMKGRSAIQCLHRWTKILKPGLVKGPWTTEEDHKLYEWVTKEGPTKWSQCAQIIVGRSGKQCRERWFNNLNPIVKKGNWTIEEDDLIFKLYMQYGSSWSKIAKHLNGRTENSIKNRFYSTIRKIAADRKKLNQVKQEDNVNGQNPKLSTEEDDKPAPFFLQNQDIKSIAGTNEILPELSLPALGKDTDTKFNQSFFANNMPTNTLYKLLQEKGSDILDPLTKEAEGMRKERKLHKKERMESGHPGMDEELITNKEALSECDSDSQFENLLMTIENTLNKELMLKEMNSYKDMTLDELQQKVFQFCNNNIVEFKEEQPEIQKDIMEINKKLGQDMMSKTLKPNNEIAQSLQTNLLNKSLDKPQNPLTENKPNFVPEVNPATQNVSGTDDQKMYFLIQQLHSLEGMLSNTREELMKLESSLNVNEKNNTLAGLFQSKNEEIDFFSDGKHQNNIFNEFFLYDNPLMNKPSNDMHAMNMGMGMGMGMGTGMNSAPRNSINQKRKNSFELTHEAGSDVFKRQKLNLPDFDISSLNFLNTILDDI